MICEKCKMETITDEDAIKHDRVICPNCNPLQPSKEECEHNNTSASGHCFGCGKNLTEPSKKEPESKEEDFEKVFKNEWGGNITDETENEILNFIRSEKKKSFELGLKNR